MPKKPTKSTRKKGRPKSWRERFLAALEETGLVGVACGKANVSRGTAYDHRKADPAFASAWDDALEAATDAMVLEARRRAYAGTLKPVFYKGEKCGSIREHSDVLLMFLLKKERPAYRDGRVEERPAGVATPRLLTPDYDARCEPSDPG